MSEAQALLILNAIPLLGAVRIRKLITYFGDAKSILKASRADLIASTLILPTVVENIIHFSKDKYLIDEYNLIRRHKLNLITAVDTNYPLCFNSFEDAPVVLYVKGDVAYLHQMGIAIVGSRAASFTGCKSAKFFARAFAQSGVHVVSGLARGIDTAAHQGALDAGGKTIAVIGCGFNHIYPKENYSLMQAISQHGVVVSEFSCAMPPLKQNFPWRNRIISALSAATVVIEAKLKSGALITADYALAQNKDVFVLPSNIDNETALGSNQLIQEGAKVALNPDDVLSQVKQDFKPVLFKEKKQVLLLTEEQLRVYPFISYEPVHLDELVRHSGFEVGVLMNITLSLELKHAIRQLPGQYYVRNEHA